MKDSFTLIGSSFVLLAMVSTNAMADDFFGDISLREKEQSQSSNLQWSGHFEQLVAYGVNSPNALVSRNEQSLSQSMFSTSIGLDWQLNDRWLFKTEQRFSSQLHLWAEGNQSNKQPNDQYSDQELDQRFDWQINDLYLQANFDQTWFRLGNQTVSWGESQSTNIIDVINPQNLSTVGQQTLDDMKVGVPGLFASWQNQQFKLESALTYHEKVNQYAASFNEFDLFAPLRSQNEVHFNQPTNPFEVTVKASTTIKGMELSAVAATVNWDEVYLKSVDNLGFHFDQARVNVFGLSGNAALGPWLIRSEFGLHQNQQLANEQSLIGQEQDVFLSMMGFEYAGINQLTINGEVSMQSNIDNDLNDQTNASGQLMWTDTNQKWQVNLFYNLIDLETPSHILRSQLQYNINDAMLVDVNFVGYQAENEKAELHNIKENDAWLVRAKYSW